MMLGLLVVASPAGAQTEVRDFRPPVDFLERSYVLVPAPDLLLEAQIAPHVSVYQNRSSEHDLKFGGLSISTSITPMIRLRIFKADSSPVRTPSFMPKLNTQILYLSRRLPGRQWGEGKPVRVHGFQFVAGHHSNGQDGCIFLGADPTACRPPDPANIRINKTDGSFSTDYFRFSAFAKLHEMFAESPTSRRTSRRSHLFGFTWETHPRWLLSRMALEDELRPIYGTNRVGASYEYERRLTSPFWAGKLRASVWGERIFKRGITADCRGPEDRHCAGPWGFGGEAAWRIKRLEETGVFVRFYQGQDYYNLGFTHRLRRLQVGFVFDASGFDDFQLPYVQE
jgi:hypothetical protein